MNWVWDGGSIHSQHALIGLWILQDELDNDIIQDPQLGR